MCISKSEKLILKAYISLPSQVVLDHKFELDEDYLAGYVSRFLSGERFKFSINIFNDEDLKYIDNLIEKNIDNSIGKDLMVYKFLILSVCSILNKYKK